MYAPYMHVHVHVYIHVYIYIYIVHPYMYIIMYMYMSSQSNVWEPPKLYFTSGVSCMADLTEVVKRHQGLVTSLEEEATHVIMPGRPPGGRDDEFYRPIQVKGRNITVHWLYYPDR